MKIELTKTQKEAIESIDKSMLVAAGAGSGKTLVLVRRFVEILQKQPELGVHNLLAVTYTRKAAKEMRTRIKARLKELYEEAKANGHQEQFRWHQCLADMDSAFIDTIHSLCQSILRTFTVEIGIDPKIEVLDEIERAQIMQESIDETFRQIIASEGTGKNLLEHFSLDAIGEFLHIALKNHLQFAKLIAEMERLSLDKLKEHLASLLLQTQKQLLFDLVLDKEWQESISHLNRGPVGAGADKLEQMRQEAIASFTNLQEFFDSFSHEHDIYFQTNKIQSAWQILLSIQTIGPLRTNGGNSDEAKAMRAAIKILIEKSKDYSQANKKGIGLPVKIALDERNDNDQYWLLWKDLLSSTKLAQNIYAAKKLELGKLDFDDLIAKVSTILKEPDSPIRKHYNKVLRHILVDEFQDTNPIQAEIISLLAGPDTTLFLIGDDKQSIYKFQGADVSTFNAWQRKSDAVISFEHSFRSHENIVNFVNSIFSVLLPEQLAHVDYRAKYRALKTQRNTVQVSEIEKEKSQPNVEVIQLPSEENMPVEGKAVAKWITDKVKAGAKIADKSGKEKSISYGDFAILTSRNSDLQMFEAALSEMGIPYVTSGGRNFLERQEIYDLENMLRFLSNPSDSHALLAVLRSPMFGLCDDLIHNLSSVPNRTLWQAMLHADEISSLKKEDGYQAVAQTIIILKRLLNDVSLFSLSELVYKIIRETNYDLVVLTLPEGKQRYKNVWKFYVLAQDNLNAAEFAQRLELSRQLSVEQTNATIESQQAVKLMTIHAAKGLEFPAVALPALSVSINSNKSKLLFHQQFGIVLNTSRTEQEKEEGLPLPFLLGKALDDDMDVAEKKRLLYVAMTRARDYLGLFLPEGSDRKHSAASWLRPLLLDNGAQHASVTNYDIDSLLQEKNGSSKNKEDEAAQVALTDLSLLEPIHSHLGSQLLSEPAISISRRITPSRTHSEASPELVGKFFHKLMEYLPKERSSLTDSELNILIEQFEEEVVHPSTKQVLLEEGKKLLSLYAHSSLQKLLANAKTISHEWMYYMNRSTEQLYSNRPDLLLETADDTWYLVDYKTDRFSAENIDQQASSHRKQLQKYGEDFLQLTKTKCKLAIYFAQHGILYEF